MGFKIEKHFIISMLTTLNKTLHLNLQWYYTPAHFTCQSGLNLQICLPSPFYKETCFANSTSSASDWCQYILSVHIINKITPLDEIKTTDDLK